MSDSVPPQDPSTGSPAEGAGESAVEPPVTPAAAADAFPPSSVPEPPVTPAAVAPVPPPFPAAQVPPPPTPVPYPPQPGQYPPAGYPAAYPAPDNGMGIAALVLGIVGLATLCAYGFGVIPAILAIIFGKIGMNKVADGTANNLGSAKAGFIMGIVGVALAVIGVIVVALVFVLAAATSTTTR